MFALRPSEGAEYGRHLLDRQGQIVVRHEMFAFSADEGAATARKFLRRRIDSSSVFEFWHGRRNISCENDTVIMEFGLPARPSCYALASCKLGFSGVTDE